MKVLKILFPMWFSMAEINRVCDEIQYGVQDRNFQLAFDGEVG